jgi:hypothetical protein
LIKFGALWFQSNGEVLQGKFGDALIIAMPNKSKKSEQSPDFELYIKEADKRPQNYAPKFDNDLDRSLASAPGYPQSGGGYAGPSNDFKIEIGKKHAGKMASQVPREDIVKSIQFFEKDGPPKGKAADFVNKAKKFLGA